MELSAPWYADNNDALASELEREVSKGHLLYGVNVKAIARRLDTDDVLFALQDETSRVAVVHLTWKLETNAAWPRVSIFQNLSSWFEATKNEHADFTDQ